MQIAINFNKLSQGIANLRYKARQPDLYQAQIIFRLHKC